MAKMTIDKALRTAKTATLKGDVAKARQLYLAILQKVPAHEEARNALQALTGGQASKQPGSRPDTSALKELTQLLAQHQHAEVKQRCEALLPRFQTSAELWFLLGSAEKFLDNAVGAEKALRQATQHKPDFALAHFLHGTVLEKLERFSDAENAYRSATKHDPKHVKAHAGLAEVLKGKGELEEAIACFEKAIELDPGNDFIRSQKLFWQANMADWRAFEEFEEVGSKLGLREKEIIPFNALGFEDNPRRHATRARFYAHQKFGTSPPPLRAKPKAPGERIRIGYFSADFRDHATLYLMSGLLREHNRERFEVYVYSYGPPIESDLLDQTKQHIDHFVDVYLKPDHEIIDAVREHGLDIALDVKGYTADSRSELFAQWLAPIQVNYLAYPGTMGADFMNYVIADPIVIPEDQRRTFSEKIITLPNCYQPNDDQRPIEDDGSTRSDHGLPEDAFVFCCFNQNYKIEPRLFDIWMRVMGKVENSVLWLIDWHRWGRENLRKHAAERGIDPDRLVFARTLPHAQHLGRLKHADLFVDTFNYTAHTTASDALWAGVPVVTKAGKQFAARVGASLVSAVGLPELITESEEDYEALMLALATDPARLSAIREKLAANRTTAPLFDTKRYTRDFEDALAWVLEEHGQAATA